MFTQVINLDGAVDRWMNCQMQFSQLGLSAERFPAIDGSLLSDSELKSVYSSSLNKRHYFTPLHIGEIGCFFSHRECWERFLASGRSYGLVLEDDFEIIGSLRELLFEIEEERPDFDLLKLDRMSAGPQHEVFSCESGVKIVRPALPPLDAAAYILSRQGARKLCESEQRIYMPVDVYLQHSWLCNIKILCTDQPLVRQEPELDSESTLKIRRPKRSIVQKISKEIKRPLFRYKLKRKALNYYHQEMEFIRPSDPRLTI